MDRTAQGLQPRFLHQAPPTDADIATVLQKISQRVKLFNFGSKDVDEVTITYPIDFLPA